MQRTPGSVGFPGHMKDTACDAHSGSSLLTSGCSPVPGQETTLEDICGPSLSPTNVGTVVKLRGTPPLVETLGPAIPHGSQGNHDVGVVVHTVSMVEVTTPVAV